MNCWELRALHRARCCDCCGEPLLAGERYFELPDGLTVCDAGDCLAEWAAAYGRLCPEEGDEDE